MANNEVNINLSVAASSNPLSIAGFTLIALLLDELDRQAVIDKQPIIERAMSTAGEFTEGALRDDVLILLRAVQAVPDGDSPPEP